MLMQDMLPRCVTMMFSEMDASERRSLAKPSLRRMPAVGRHWTSTGNGP